MLHRPVFTALLFGLVFFCFGNAQGSDGLKDFDGKTHSITDYAGQGKWLVVMLWASDCHVCNQEAHQYVDFHANHANKDAMILGVSLDGDSRKTEAKRFMEKHKINFPSLIGEPEVVAGIYQNLTGSEWIGTPTFMVYTPKGELVAAQVGAVPPEIIESFMERESKNETK